tara:strand:- start:1015 stop:1386 length:372 start_codon:yes stop_codon:yes gene_type:complete
MTEINTDLLFPDMSLEKINNILVRANTLITKLKIWKRVLNLKFTEPNIEQMTDVDIEPVDPDVIALINTLRFNMDFIKNDTILLHTLLFLKHAKKNNYVIDELPFLVKEEDFILNPILYGNYN